MLGFGNLDSLAVRRDLPQFEQADIDKLCEEGRRRVATEKVVGQRHFTEENRQIHDLIPWLARYARKEFEATCLGLWRHVLSSKESWPGLLDLDELIPGQDPRHELVGTILRQADQLCSQEHHGFAFIPPTELMLLHANLDQLMEWLGRLEDKSLERGGSPVICVLPLPEAFARLAPDGLAHRARQRFEAAQAASRSGPDQPKLKCIARHWLYIYSYVAKPTKEDGQWALSLANGPDGDADLLFALFHLLCACPDWDVYQRALTQPAFRPFQLGFNSWRWARRIPADSWQSFTFERLKVRTSFTVSGWLLRCNERDDELRKWGKALANAALDVDTTEWTPKTDVEFHVDDKGGVAGVTFDSPPGGGGHWHDVSSPAWGVDRHSQCPAPTQRDRDAALDQFHADIEKLNESPRREFTDFNAADPVFRWSQLEPETFAAFAEEFLCRLWQKGLKEVVDLSFFATILAIALLRLKPERALQFSEFRTPGIRFRVFTFDGALAWATRELWSSALNDSPEIQGLRRRLLLEAPNDEVIFWHVAAAHAGQNAEEIRHLADSWIAASTARDRALGVTLLAFQGDEASVERLSRCRDSDPSFWVREHATWAVEVCALESACKRRYAEVLQSPSLRELAIGFAELHMAFTPLVRAWKLAVEREAGWPRQDARMNAYHDLFWYHWCNTTSRKENFAILGRKLCEHCRGERLKDGVTSRQSPWWRLEK